MKKEEYVRRYGEEAYHKKLEQKREWNKANPELRLASQREASRKGGRYYEKWQLHDATGLRRERRQIRAKHRDGYRKYKKIIAPDSQLHHAWRPESALYDGLALVEADQHMRGFIDVIQVLEGEITLFTEKEIREQEEV